MDFDCQVCNRRCLQDGLAVETRVAGRARHQGNDAAVTSRSHLPEMEIRHTNVVDALYATTDCIRHVGRRDHVEKLSRGVAAEPDAPLEDDDATDDTHEWVEKRPAPIAAPKKCSDRKHAREGVGQDMEIRCPEVVVMSRVSLAVIVMVVLVILMAVMLIRVEQLDADQVDEQAENRDG